jgi:hypothetical protein
MEKPVFISNEQLSPENPTYIVSRQIGTIIEVEEDAPKVEDIPRYIVQQEETTTS